MFLDSYFKDLIILIHDLFKYDLYMSEPILMPNIYGVIFHLENIVNCFFLSFHLYALFGIEDFKNIKP